MLGTIQDFVRQPRPSLVGAKPLDPRLLRALIALAVFIGLLERTPAAKLESCVVGVAMAFALRWYQTHALWLTLAFNAFLVYEISWAEVSTNGLFGLAIGLNSLIAIYAVGRWGSGVEVLIGGAAVLARTVYGELNFGLSFNTELVILSMWELYPIGFGIAARTLAGERQRNIDAARLNERHEIARELHDTVAHHVSAIAIQAQAARAVAKTKPEAPLEILETIEEQAARTLAEMRRMVTVLRDDESEGELHPQSGLHDIAGLASSHTTGPSVEVTLEGTFDQLSSSVQASLFRLAQEGITNARRHARDATRIQVVITEHRDRVDLSIIDDGRRIGQTPSAGYGLTGLGERAAQLGGTFQAGPGPVRGWIIEASIPLMATT